MSRQQFEALVQRLEPFAKREPQVYQVLVGLLALLGYAYILGVLIVSFALLIGLIGGCTWLLEASHGGAVVAAFKIAVPLGIALLGLIGTIVRSFQVKFPPPEGVSLQRSEAPRLFVMLDDLSARLRAPRFHHILVTDEFNAGVSQVPRLGLLGWQTNYLVIGLPLMQALTPDQFRAVIAHEFGHLSASHSRFSGWIYRLRRTWFQLLVHLQRERHRGAWVFHGFFGWYAPFFQAYTFVLARANEYVADRCAAETAGKPVIAEALISLKVQGRYLQEKYWPDVRKAAQDQADPPGAPFAAMFQALQHTHTPQEADQWLDEALRERTGLGDTHPSLTDRLSALGFRAAPGGPLDLPKPPLPAPPPPTETAAQRYLGPVSNRFTQRFDTAWRQGIAPKWREQYAQAQQDRRKMEGLHSQAQKTRLSEQEAWEYAELTVRFGGIDAGVPLLRQMVTAQPDHPKANYVLGCVLLDKNDPAGLTYLEKGMAREPERAASGCEAAYWFLRRQGRLAEAMRYRERAKQAQDQWLRAQEERDSVKPDDRFLYHGLSAEDVQRLRSQLLGVPDVGAAYLVRKAVRVLPERPFYVLGILPSARRPPREDHAMATRLMRQLHLPGETVLVLMSRERRLARALRQAASAQIYRKP